MSRTNLKRYLTLLAVIGLVAIASGGGSGTFASFSAEVSNNSNYFATGTLILNDNGGTNTCTSSGDISNLNNSSTNDCDTLFKLNKFTFGQSTLNQASLSSADGANAAITITAVTGAAIYKGDTLTITGGGNTETLPVKSYAAVGAVTVTVDASGLVNTYTTGATISDNNATFFANLTLTNAGTIDASGISFKNGAAACTAAYTEGHSTLNMGTVVLGASSGTTLTFASAPGAFKTGDAVVVSESGHSNTFIAQSNSTSTQVTVTAAQPWNFAYDTSAVVSGPEFNGASAHNLCTNLKLAMVETTVAFNQSLSGAVGCAYGSVTNVVAPNACDFGASTALSSIPTSSFAPLTLASGQGSGNTGTLLSASGGTRYLLLAVHYTGANFDNTYQNTKTTSFDLRWHIDQV